MSKRFPWLKLQRKSQPELPLRPPMWLGSRSNGEYFHEQTREERLIQRLVLERADEQARRVGMDRREFLASSMGMLTTLAVINQVGGCGGANGDGTSNVPVADMPKAGSYPVAGASTGAGANAGGQAGMSAPAGRPGAAGASGAGAGGARAERPMPSAGRGAPPAQAGSAAAGSGSPLGQQCPYVVPVDATCEETTLLSGDEFIFDIQTHSFDEGEWRQKNPTYTNFLGLLAMTVPGCNDVGLADQLDCFDADHYGKYMFVDSDTTVSVITSWPAQVCSPELQSNCGLPLSNVGMRQLRDQMNERMRSQRVVNQIQVMPNDRWELQRDVMTMAVQDPAWRAVSWKAYPAWGPSFSGGSANGYFLNSPLGRAFIEHGLSLGVPNFAIHKGLPIPGFDIEHNQPLEIGEIAKAYPEANFIIYHSGIGSGGGNLLGVGSGERAPFDESIAEPRMHRGVNQLIAALRQQGITAANNTNVYGELGSAWSNVMNDPIAAQHMMGKLLKHLGPDRIVWGTDCIIYGSPQPQIEAFRMFQITPEFQQRYGYPALTAEIKAKIFGLNAAKLFCIDPAAKRCAASASTFAALRRRWDAEHGPRRFTIQEPLGPTSRREFLQLARRSIALRRPGA